MSEHPGKKLLAWRTRKGLSQKAAGALINVRAASWCDWENGRKVPRVDMAFLIQELTRCVRASDWRGVSSERRGAA